VKMSDFAIAAVHAAIDRRSEPRYFADEGVILCRSGSDRLIGPARVCDTSAHGFRVLHTLALNVGDTVTVMTPSCDFVTRVVWVREHGCKWEAGLYVTENACPQPR
jgi:hypothetical protein